MITNIDTFDDNLFSKNEIGIEIQTFPQHILDLDISFLIEKWKKKLINFKGMISLHGSSFDLNPGSTDLKILDVTRLRYMQSIELANTLKASHVIFHSQVNPLISVRKIRDLKLNNQIEFWIDLIDTEIPRHINVLIENEYDDTYEDIKKIFDGVNRKNFGICLDIGHVLAYSKLSLEDWISNLGDRIKYIHLHWNNGISDEHNKPTEEDLVILRQLLNKFELNPIVTMEYKVNNISEEVQRLKKYLF